MTAPVGSPDGRPPRAWRSPRAWVVLIAVLAAGLAVDLSLKHWTFANVVPDTPVRLDRGDHIPVHAPVRVVPRLLNLHLVKNEGAVFGIGSRQRMFFIVFTLGALAAAMAVFARWTCAGATFAHASLGLIMAGGMGNLYDRLRWGVVRDFLHMLPGWKLPFGWRWPGGSDEIFPWVFNAADVMLLVGMAMLMLYINRVEKERKAARAAAAAKAGGNPQPESA